jgi:hydrogenase nickel incorporation protein HypB
MTEIKVVENILGRNDAQAVKNRSLMSRALCLNLMSSPGAGKTTLLERTLDRLGRKHLIGVIEGDIATSNDARRLRRFARPGTVYQIKTENYGGGCHLDADMVATGLAGIRAGSKPYDLIFIENVGNLICPAEFNLGEHKKVVLLSVTEGDDKPLKYPVIFKAADLVLVTKTDLLAHTDFSLKRAHSNIRKVHPRARILDCSSTSRDGFTEWLKQLEIWINDKQNSRIQPDKSLRPPARPNSK